MNEFDVVIIGSASRDVFLSSPDFKIQDDSELSSGQALVLPLGSKIEIKKIVLVTGGSATNTAVTLARQGLKTTCISIVGQDPNAEAILKELADEGVDTGLFQKHNDDLTAYSVILVQGGGERTILSYKGEGQHFEAKKISLDQLKAQWLVVGSLGGHFDLFEKSVNWASTNNVKIAINPGTKELKLGLEKLKPFLKQATIISMNQEEASQLLGIEFSKEDEIFKAMDGIVDGIFVMTKGHEGVAVSDGLNIYRASVPDSPIVERTGAGDAFISGFVAEYIHSADIAKSIQLATANSSSVVTQYGSKAGILRKGDVGPWPLVEVTSSNK